MFASCSRCLPSRVHVRKAQGNRTNENAKKSNFNQLHFKIHLFGSEISLSCTFELRLRTRVEDDGELLRRRADQDLPVVRRAVHRAAHRAGAVRARGEVQEEQVVLLDLRR